MLSFNGKIMALVQIQNTCMSNILLNIEINEETNILSLVSRRIHKASQTGVVFKKFKVSQHQAH